jgi:hypothetical protein
MAPWRRQGRSAAVAQSFDQTMHSCSDVLARLKWIFCFGYGRHGLVADSHEEHGKGSYRLGGEHGVLEEAD